jgi:hypothetical protein
VPVAKNPEGAARRSWLLQIREYFIDPSTACSVVCSFDAIAAEPEDVAKHITTAMKATLHVAIRLKGCFISAPLFTGSARMDLPAVIDVEVDKISNQKLFKARTARLLTLHRIVQSVAATMPLRFNVSAKRVQDVSTLRP